MANGKRLLMRLFCYTLAAFCHADLSQAATTAADLQQQADAYLQHVIREQNLANSQYEIAPIDPRLQLADCAEPLKIALFNPPQPLAGRITLQINCNTLNPWKIYIKATVHVRKAVVVAMRPLARGHALTTEDVQLQERPLESLRQNYFDQPSAVIGKTLKQALAAGTVISANALDNARMVTKNQQVTISSGTSATINVKTTGVALSDGSQGERIKVRNSASNKVIEATVLAPGLVSVNP
jgi:flagella basal body P-ring formation protein FlgA